MLFVQADAGAPRFKAEFEKLGMDVDPMLNALRCGLLMLNKVFRLQGIHSWVHPDQESA